MAPRGSASAEKYRKAIAEARAEIEATPKELDVDAAKALAKAALGALASFLDEVQDITEVWGVGEALAVLNTVVGEKKAELVDPVDDEVEIVEDDDERSSAVDPADAWMHLPAPGSGKTKLVPSTSTGTKRKSIVISSPGDDDAAESARTPTPKRKIPHGVAGKRKSAPKSRRA